MFTRIIKTTVIASLLMSLAACTNTQTTPSMVDYSYVPPAQVMTPTTSPGIQDF
jgi:hypothetical protein